MPADDDLGCAKLRSQFFDIICAALVGVFGWVLGSILLQSQIRILVRNGMFDLPSSHIPDSPELSPGVPCQATWGSGIAIPWTNRGSHGSIAVLR